MSVDRLHHALGNLSHLGVIEVRGITPAFAFANGHLGRIKVIAIWSERLCSPVKISWTRRILDIAVRTVNLLARELHRNSSVVESAEPVCACIRAQGPFTLPNFVLVKERIGILGVHFKVLTKLLGNAHVMVPSHVSMVVNGHQVRIPILKGVIPNVPVKSERIMEQKVSLGSVLLHKLANFSVKVLQHVNVGVDPWFVDGLVGQ